MACILKNGSNRPQRLKFTEPETAHELNSFATCPFRDDSSISGIMNGVNSACW